MKKIIFVFFVFIQACTSPDIVLFTDDFSEPIALIIDSLVKKENPNFKIKIMTGKADFLAQSIYFGRKADILISGNLTEFFKKNNFSLKPIPISSDALVLATRDTSIHTWNDIVTKKKIISVPMFGSPIYYFWEKWRNDERIDQNLLKKRYFAHPKTANLQLQIQSSDTKITYASLCTDGKSKILDYYKVLEPVHFIYQVHNNNSKTDKIINLIKTTNFRIALKNHGYQ